MTSYDAVLARLEDVTGSPAKGANGSRSSRCPAHADRDPSLTVTHGDDGRTLLKCHAGCAPEAVVAALGLTMADLFEQDQPAKQQPRTVARYPYVDEQDELLYTVERLEPGFDGKRKSFVQRPASGKRGAGAMAGVRLVLYRLPAVLAAVAAGTTIMVVEGEKDAEAAERAGLVATTCPMGAGSWKPTYTEMLRGADVVIVADADPAGRAHAASIARSLEGVAGDVRCAEPRHGKDLSEHLAAGHTVEDLILIENRWASADVDLAPSEPMQHPPDEGVVAFIATELGLPVELAALLAPRVEERAGHERITGLARRLVRDQQLTRDADLTGIDVVTGAALLARERPPRARVFGDLVLDGHNVTVVGRKKVGKSTLSEEMLRAAATGGNFLGRYTVTAPMRVAYLNYELDERDMDNRVRRIGLDDQALERLLVLNLRGRRLPLMTSTGRNWLVERLVDHGAELLIVDPFGAAYAAAGGESENDNAEVRRFTTALDEIKRLANIGTLVMPVHTGTAEQEAGEERARGASVLEDWPDVLMYLTKDRHDQRFLRTDGRAPFRLYESRLGYDEANGRLMLATGDLGVNRTKAKERAALEAAVAVIRAEPGMTSRRVREALGVAGVKNNDEKDSAVSGALAEHQIHTHSGQRTAVLHYFGPSHGEDEPCPEGWNQ